MSTNAFPTSNRNAPPHVENAPLWPSTLRRTGAATWLLCAVLSHCGPGSWPGGVHAVFGWSKQGVRVVSVPEGPAARAGLFPDDRLIAIDGKPVAGLSTDEVKKRLGGEVGSFVTLTVERAGERVDVRVERAPYEKPPR